MIFTTPFFYGEYMPTKGEKKFYRRKTGGQAMLIAVVFFLFINLAVISGLVVSPVREFRNASLGHQSKQSYFLAESGVEDAYYRILNNLPIAEITTLTLGGNTATTAVTSSGNQKEIIALGEVQNLERKISLSLTTGIGVSFNYGIQTGYGGLALSNNAGVNGNVYANGSIIGGNNSFITGSAFAANTPAQAMNQSNLEPVPSPNSITFRNASSSQDLGQKFQVTTTEPVSKVQFYIKKTGNPNSATVKIVNDNGDKPGTTVLGSGSLVSTHVTTAYSLVNVVITSPPSLTAGTNYWLVIDNSSNSSSNYYTVAANSAYPDGYAKVGQLGGTWNNTSPSQLDAYFAIFTGGVNAVISGITIGAGTTGDAWANTVNHSIVQGNLYCQTGSGNNKPCNTSQPNPSPQPMPISEGNVAEFKSQAEAGGVWNGNKTITSSAESLGPLKIEGNLTVTNNATLTVTGTLWVTGNITLDNNVVINLHSSFGSSSAVIVTDGRVSISNNVNFNGSGTEGSYIMVLSTSDCPGSSSCGGSPAINVGNNAGTVILVAQNGTIQFSNNAGAKEAVARTLSLNNNAVITYETGLANVNFTSGPSGGWAILNWKEIE
jgi:hypothetical protein